MRQGAAEKTAALFLLVTLRERELQANEGRKRKHDAAEAVVKRLAEDLER